MHKISKCLQNHYSDKYSKYGPTSEGVDWGSNSDLAAIRQAKMLGVIKESKDEVTLLDVGCGYGHLAEIISKSHKQIKYSGVDVVADMRVHAKKTSPQFDFYHGDFLTGEFGVFDYLVCNGILTQKLTATTLEMNLFAQDLIKKMYQVSRKGIAFNVMNTHVNFQIDKLYYRSPVELLGWCTSELTPHVVIDAAYKLWFEYTVYLYKPNFIQGKQDEK